MLTKLYVSNYAIINEINVDFTNGLNIITGETGAGKSILLGALSLILGQRANSSLLSNSNKKSVVEGSFDISAHNLQPFFTAHDLDFEPLTIIRRERTQSGKSRAFINDTPVRLDILQSLTSQLVDLHRQHENLTLANTNFQRNIIDGFAGIQQKVNTYSKQFTAYNRDMASLEALQQAEAQQLQDLDFWKFQVNEISSLAPQLNEEVTLKNELSLASRAGEVKTKLRALLGILDTENGINSNITQASTQLHSLEDINEELQILSQRFSSSVLEIKDIIAELYALEEKVDVDEEKLQELTQRSDELNRLLNKHRVNSVEELIAKLNGIETSINKASTDANKIVALQEKLTAEKLALQKQANIISIEREKANPLLITEIENYLAQMGMPNAQLTINLIKGELNAFGQDGISFGFSANKGMTAQEIGKVASGGELSRLLLAIKAVIAGKIVLPTMIFDEIDTGISGETAMRVGAVMRELANQHQIIAITHLPQIAGRGNHHLSIYKEDVDGVTHSKIKTLDSNERIIAIAQMLSGADPSDTSLKTAKELLGNN